jgi:hypothetical protein
MKLGIHLVWDTPGRVLIFVMTPLKVFFMTILMGIIVTQKGPTVGLMTPQSPAALKNHATNGPRFPIILWITIIGILPGRNVRSAG